MQSSSKRFPGFLPITLSGFVHPVFAQKKPVNVLVLYSDRAVRTANNRKLIKYNLKQQQTTQLLDLNKAPYETRNLAGDPAFRRKKQQLETRLVNEMKKYHDFLNFGKPNWGK
ncbi:hypothetical protein [Larkinella terrae]|uniref:Uncharacterized protein n=1 Tax=Larkinella terrae TaxID=2025311 RepID=A0A7K0EHG9_9BACT|nr:hypothetical protein [Larkinella terrae]MRS60896.1 hypothetical protein [Larkinella terrae]